MSASTADIVLYETDDKVGLVTLNRPDKRNALSTELMSELMAVLSEIGADRTKRAVILAGSGPAFSAGHDLAELSGRDLAFYRYVFDLCSRLMETVQSIPQPVTRCHRRAAGLCLAANRRQSATVPARRLAHHSKRG